MKDNNILIRRQIAYDIRQGILLQYKKHLIFAAIIVFLFALFYRRVRSYDFIPEDSMVGFWDYLIYLFRGKEVIGSLSQLDVFDIPIEWLLLHSYVLLSVGTYPKEDYKERGYQILLRLGNKWYWWLSKGVYTIVAVIVYYLIFATIAFGFTMIQGASFRVVNELVCYNIIGINGLELTSSDLIWGTCIMPMLIFIALCITEIVLSFLTSTIIAIIILLGYLSASAYWCNGWLLGNYTMLLRHEEISFFVGTIISIVSIITFFTLGYCYFNQLDAIGKRKEEIS